MISRKARFVIASVAAVALVVALGSIVLAAEHGVAIDGFAYSPSPLTIRVGDTVTWKNGDAVSHTATADDGSWDAGTIASGSLGSQTFDTAGTFAYHCTIHSSMHGTLVVEAAAASQPPAGGPPLTDASPPPAADAGPSPFVALLLVAAAALGLELGRRRFARRDAAYRPAQPPGAARPAAPWLAGQSGGMFWLIRKRFSGSYRRLTRTRRS